MRPGRSPAAAAANAEGLRRDALRERLALFGLSLPALLLVATTMIAPIGWLFWLSFLGDDGAVGLANYRRLLEEPSYARIFATTFEISAAATALCVAFGYPLAYLLSQMSTRLANLCLIGVLLPFWTSILVRTYAWLTLLQRHGLINTWGVELGLWREPLALVYNVTGTLIGTVHIMLPFLILPLYGSMRAIDRDYLKAAANLGASPVRAFWQVFFPLSLPGLLAGATMVFILCLGFYVTPAMLGGGRVIMVANRVANDVDVFFNWGAASALGVVLLAMTMVLLYVASRLAPLSRTFDERGL